MRPVKLWAPWTPEAVKELLASYAAGKPWDVIGKEMGRSAESCRNKERDQRRSGAAGNSKAAVRSAEPGDTQEQLTESEAGDSRTLVYHGAEIRTVAQLLEHTEIDLTLWEVSESTVNAWQVAGKFKGNDSLWKTGLLQIKVKLRRLAPKLVQDGIKLLLQDVRPLATAKPKPLRKGDRQLLEIGLFDHHFGKLCWGSETGTNYDLKIAEQEFRAAIDAMLSRTTGYNVERIVFPVGNDFFHVNDWLGQTANQTRVESTDDRFCKVFQIGCRSVQYAIERCLQRAPVDVLWVPGNHDRHTSWFLTEWLGAIFRASKYVTIDNSPGYRKYLRYGVNLLGYMHGDEVKHADLPALMATERKQMWADTSFRSWRLGHWHKRKETRYVAGDTHQGVEVKILSSLAGTDSWHYNRGFIGNTRMAECSLFDLRHGPIANFLINAQEPHRTTQARI